jgi:hypothetical protein
MLYCCRACIAAECQKAVLSLRGWMTGFAQSVEGSPPGEQQESGGM